MYICSEMFKSIFFFTETNDLKLLFTFIFTCISNPVDVRFVYLFEQKMFFYEIFNEF